MADIINISIKDNIIKAAADHILTLKNNGINLSDIAVLMPSKRPSLFIKKELSKRIKTAFISPAFLTFDRIINDVCKLNNRQLISKIDSAYIIYNIVQKHIPDFYSHAETFAGFFDWSCEILNFTESADVECVSDDKLLNIKANAEIGYDVPENINTLLKNLYTIRKEFHNYLDTANKTTRGYCYSTADIYVKEVLKKYKKLILFNPYYLNKSETKIFKTLYDTGRLDIIIKGSSEKYPALKNLYRNFEIKPVPINENDDDSAEIKFYSAYDKQAQSCLVKNLIKNIPEKELSDTIIVLPDNTVLPSVMSEIYSVTDNINIAAGYPASQTTVFALIESVIEAQRNRKNGRYYVKDLLSVLANPLVKNMRFIGLPEITRITVHTIAVHFDRNHKKALFKDENFINLNDIKNNTDLCREISVYITNYWKENVSEKRISELIGEILNFFFERPEQLLSLNDLGVYLKEFADNIVQKSLINTYPLNLGAINIIYNISGQFIKTVCSKEQFTFNDILFILEKMLSSGTVSLIGSPLKGLQVLGTLESRGLTFKNVFVLSMSEQIIPHIKESSPLIPKDIMTFLGIEYAGNDSDIQRYHFTSLVSSAENVNLIYIDDDTTVRSRFIEELIWTKQKKEKNLNAVKVLKAVLPVKKTENKKREFSKTPEIKKILKDFNYSATGIDTYLECKLKFYYKYILSLKEYTGFEDAENFESRDIGNCVHEIFENTLKKDVSKKEIISETFKNKFLNTAADIINKKFNKNDNGRNYLINKILLLKIEEFYNFESSDKRDFDTILSAEDNLTGNMTVDGTTYKLCARLDRIDINCKNDIYIIDYKTGEFHVPCSQILPEDSFSRETIKKYIKSFQLPLYKYLYEQNNNAKVADCMFYSVKDIKLHNLFKEKKNCPTPEERYKSYIKQLNFIIKEINSDTPFKYEEYDKCQCEKCPYFFLCR